MTNHKQTFDEQTEYQSSGNGQGMREKKSKLRRRHFVDCQNPIFLFATVVLIILFIQQVSTNVRIELIIYVLLTLKMTKCLIKYAEDPTYISSRIVDQWEADFPAITVCPEYNGLKLDVLQVSLGRQSYHVMNLYTNCSFLKENGISSVKGYNRISNANPNISWSSNKTGVTEKQLYDQITRNPKELFNYIYTRYLSLNKVG